MAQISVELHEKYIGEKISDSDHAVVHEEIGNIGAGQTVAIAGVTRHLPRGCYYAENTSSGAVETAWSNIELRLGRRASVLATIGGHSYGFGLRQVQAPAALLGRLLAPTLGTTPQLKPLTNLLGSLAPYTPLTILTPRISPLFESAEPTPDNPFYAAIAGPGTKR